jgi:aspartate racemase
MVEDSGPLALVTDSELLARLPEVAAPVVLVDTDRDAIAARPTRDPDRSATPDDLAYVTYTSGSTGTPKGVMVAHRGVVRLVVSADYVDVSPEDVFLQFAPISFDASTFEIWAPLLNGARVALADPENLSLPEVRHALEHYGVTVLWLTASLFNIVIEANPPELRTVRQLLAGGDALSVGHVTEALARLPETRLINGYGPTENTTFTCCHPVDELPTVASSVPIGRPIANTQVYLLDPHYNPVPQGVPGELYIGGAGLARGYLNCPDLTAGRFVPDPFSTTAGARLYRTGDRARYLKDGNIEFLGRVDHQVKIRGFRIEPGEIEAALLRHPALNDAVVLARQDGATSDKLLVAYVVVNGEALTTTELRAHLLESLPNYMVPAAFVTLDALPLTPNGKVDRSALPAPEGSDLANSYVAPRSSGEEVLAAIWCEVLGLERVGVHDNFFDLGGHSLVATQLVARLWDGLGINVTVRTVFEASTVAALAEVVEGIILEELESVAASDDVSSLTKMPPSNDDREGVT